MDKIVDNSTQTVLNSASPPNLSAKRAVLVALGIDNSKNTAYFIADETGRNATARMDTKDITISFIADAA